MKDVGKDYGLLTKSTVGINKRKLQNEKKINEKNEKEKIPPPHSTNIRFPTGDLNKDCPVNRKNDKKGLEDDSTFEELPSLRQEMEKWKIVYDP